MSLSNTLKCIRPTQSMLEQHTECKDLWQLVQSFQLETKNIWSDIRNALGNTSSKQPTSLDNQFKILPRDLNQRTGLELVTRPEPFYREDAQNILEKPQGNYMLE